MTRPRPSAPYSAAMENRDSTGRDGYDGLDLLRESLTMSIAERMRPPLRPGQRLTVREFLRRWESMPAVKFAELIDGVVDR